jgi:hypothetical protein
MARQKILSRIAIPVALVSCGFFPLRMEAQTPGAGVIVYLDPMTTAGVGGTVNLAPKGEETNLQVTLNPGEGPESAADAYRMQVVEGSCATPGRVVEGLGDVHADGKTTRQQGALRLSDVRNGDHVIQVADKHHKKVVACGLIPARDR